MAFPFGGHECGRTSRLFKLQKKAIRVVFGMQGRQSCRGTFQSNNILTFPSLYIFSCLMFVHKHPHIFPPKTSHYTSRNPFSLQVPAHKTSFFERHCFFSCIKLFNKLPKSLQEIESTKKFKIKVKCI